MDNDVRIVRLEPFRAAVANGYGASPEEAAMAKIRDYARKNDLLKPGVRFFGYNNPNPSPGTPNYGYDMCMTVSHDAPGEPGIEMRAYTGGLYGVLRCQMIPEQIFPSWQKLVAWLQQSDYRYGNDPCLEEHLYLGEDPDKLSHLDLYLPIRSSS